VNRLAVAKEKSMVSAVPVRDLSPKILAGAIDSLVDATMDTDRETAAIHQLFREGPRAISWTR
jgi:hypothetical protein